MVIERSRRWVKDRIPAFICRETNWLVSRWVQANVFLCPHCREEYRSLKKVWDHLDKWDCDEPAPQCEISFSNRFREQFPSAFTQETASTRKKFFESGYGKLAYAGGVFALALVCSVALKINMPDHQGSSQKSAEAPVVTPVAVPQIADAVPASEASAQVEAPGTLPARPSLSERQMQHAGAPVRMVSHGPSIRPKPASQSGARLVNRHAVEINNHPVSAGFLTLSLPAEEQAY